MSPPTPGPDVIEWLAAMLGSLVVGLGIAAGTHLVARIVVGLAVVLSAVGLPVTEVVGVPGV